LSRLRPPERILLAFAAYAVVRLAASGDLRVASHALPPVDVLLALGSVVTGRLVADYRRTPWPDTLAGLRRLHLSLLPVLVLGAVSLVIASPAFQPVPGTGGGVTAELLLAAHAWTCALLLLLVPSLLFWLATAQHLKAYGRIDTLAMLRARMPGAREALRDWLPVVGLVYAYGLMSPVLGRAGHGDMDETLARLDRALFAGRDPGVLLEAWISRPLSTWLSAAYVLYVPLLPVVLGGVYARRDLARFRELSYALTMTLALGYVGYTLVPAQGPLFLKTYAVPLDGYYGDWIKRDLLDPVRVPRDCFPSLHTAVSMVLSWGAYRHVRPLFWATLPVVASIPLACVYFRYHYVVDVIAGAALAVFAVAWSARGPNPDAPRG
jgi:membrane-associated phospholipid phosphatase